MVLGLALDIGLAGVDPPSSPIVSLRLVRLHL